jgi:hypothetical protein
VLCSIHRRHLVICGYCCLLCGADS